MVDVKEPAKEWRLFRVNFNNDVSLFPNKKKKKWKIFKKNFFFYSLGFLWFFLFHYIVILESLMIDLLTGSSSSNSSEMTV